MSRALKPARLGQDKANHFMRNSQTCAFSRSSQARLPVLLRYIGVLAMAQDGLLLVFFDR